MKPARARVFLVLSISLFAWWCLRPHHETSTTDHRELVTRVLHDIASIHDGTVTWHFDTIDGVYGIDRQDSEVTFSVEAAVAHLNTTSWGLGIALGDFPSIVCITTGHEDGRPFDHRIQFRDRGEFEPLWAEFAGAGEDAFERLCAKHGLARENH